MFKKNDNNYQQSKKSSSTPIMPPDLSEFDRDLEIYGAELIEYEDKPSPADGSIPSFGARKSVSKVDQSQVQPQTSHSVNNRSGSRKKLETETKDAQKGGRSKRVLTRQDNRWRFFFGLALFVVGLAGSIVLVQANTKGIEVVVATRDIAPGQTITEADLVTARMSVPPDLAALLVDSREISSLTGNGSGTSPTKVAARKLRGHGPIMQGDIVAATTLNKTGVPEGMVAMALPASPATSVARISAGDKVTLLYVNTKSSVSGFSGPSETNTNSKNGLETSLLAERIVVLDVTRSSSGIGLGSGSNTGGNNPTSGDNSSGTSSRGAITNLTLLLTVEQARKLAVAKQTGTVDVVLLPFQLETMGATPATEQKPGSLTPDNASTPLLSSPLSAQPPSDPTAQPTISTRPQK